MYHAMLTMIFSVSKHRRMTEMSLHLSCHTLSQSAQYPANVVRLTYAVENTWRVRGML